MDTETGGFLPLALYVKAELGLDYAFANQVRRRKPNFINFQSSFKPSFM